MFGVASISYTDTRPSIALGSALILPVPLMAQTNARIPRALLGGPLLGVEKAFELNYSRKVAPS